MLRSPSTRGQVNSSVIVSPVSGNIAGSSPAGEIGPKSTTSARAPPGGCTTMKPIPPRPLFHGSRTASAKAAATTASTADPPAANISAPTVAATPFWEATTPPREAATGFRTTQFCINAAISDDLDRIDAALVKGVMPGEPHRLFIRRPIGPDRIFRALHAAIDLDRPIGAIALERAIGLVIRRAHQIEPHILLRNVLHRLVARLLAAHGRGRVGDRLTGKGDAHAARFGEQVDAVLGFFQITGGGICHGSSPRLSESSRMAAAG